MVTHITALTHTRDFFFFVVLFFLLQSKKEIPATAYKDRTDATIALTFELVMWRGWLCSSAGDQLKRVPQTLTLGADRRVVAMEWGVEGGEGRAVSVLKSTWVK